MEGREGGPPEKGVRILTDSWAEMRDAPRRANQEAGWRGKGRDMQIPPKGDYQWVGEAGGKVQGKRGGADL